MRIILLGAPGSGKGTQSALIQETYGVPQISTGDILRQAVTDRTELGKKAEDFMRKGALVPDELILGLVRDRIAQDDAAKGFIFDGFPRSGPQAEGLDELFQDRGISLDRAIQIHVPFESIMTRMTSRRVCGDCNAVYSLVNKPPQKDGVCDNCGGQVVQREDDTEETVRHRLEVYEASTAPLIEYYQGKELLTVVEGDAAVETVFESVKEVLDGISAG